MTANTLVVICFSPRVVIPVALDRYQFSPSFRALPSLQISNVDLESHRLHTGDTR